MYYTGINPLDMKKVYCPTDYREKQMQRALLQYGKPENRNLVREALTLAGREDLIGFGKECLVKPDMRATAPVQKHAGHGAINGSGKSAKNGKNASKNAKNGAKSKEFSKNSKNKSSGKNVHSPAKNSKKGRK
jgi:hypothetical protein